MKVILNKRYGGFDVSDAAYELYAKKKGITLYKYTDQINRDMTRVYTRVDFGDRVGVMTHYFTCDFGKNPDEKSVDWSKMLYLSSEHREDKTLIEVVEELGKAASGSFGELVIVEIPDGMDYVIDDYDGFEMLHEKVQVW